MAQESEAKGSKRSVQLRQSGALIISLDFELYWGIREKLTVADGTAEILGARCVIPRLLSLFSQYDIHATWATVGFLFFDTYEQLIAGLPAMTPSYSNAKYSPYEYISRHGIGKNEKEDPLHYGASLVKMISSTPNQEIGTHTFSHYYCLENGQSAETFREDLKAAIRAAAMYDLKLESMVFPRNQINDSYLSICRELGIKSYRGAESPWIYKRTIKERETLIRKAPRIIDSHLNLFGHNTYDAGEIGRSSPLNIRSSRFLRCYSNKPRFLQYTKLNRIRSDLTHAAQNRLIYHLWWHPRNFGLRTEENLWLMEEILRHYSVLRNEYGMESLNMRDLARKIEATC